MIERLPESPSTPPYRMLSASWDSAGSCNKPSKMVTSRETGPVPQRCGFETGHDPPSAPKATAQAVHSVMNPEFFGGRRVIAGPLPGAVAVRGTGVEAFAAALVDDPDPVVPRLMQLPPLIDVVVTGPLDCLGWRLERMASTGIERKRARAPRRRLSVRLSRHRSRKPDGLKDHVGDLTRAHIRPAHRQVHPSQYCLSEVRPAEPHVIERLPG